MAADGWEVENIKHKVEYESNKRTQIYRETDEEFCDLYPTEVKTITTFFRYVNKDVTSAEIPDTW